MITWETLNLLIGAVTDQVGLRILHCQFQKSFVLIDFWLSYIEMDLTVTFIHGYQTDILYLVYLSVCICP